MSMTGVGAPTAGAASADPSQEAKLRRTAHQLEGVFVEQLFKAMRATVPDQGGVVDRGAGEEMFSGMLDAHVAAEAPEKWHTGLGEALYRQLRSALPQSDATSEQSQQQSKTQVSSTTMNASTLVNGNNPSEKSR